MNIALLGYGKMGKEIEKILLSKKHNISFRATSKNTPFSWIDLKTADVAIDFSKPNAVIRNITTCFEANIPIIVGTTGWYDSLETITAICISGNKSLFYASNFSIGMNIFFELNKKLAKRMNSFPNYEISIEEAHHIHKIDAPSGTAITLAEDIITNVNRKSTWREDDNCNSSQLKITSQREGEIPGTHCINYDSSVDKISIKHEAKNRIGFAAGAVEAAEWMVGKKGIFTMKDLLKL